MYDRGIRCCQTSCHKQHTRLTFYTSYRTRCFNSTSSSFAEPLPADVHVSPKEEEHTIAPGPWVFLGLGRRVSRFEIHPRPLLQRWLSVVLNPLLPLWSLCSSGVVIVRISSFQELCWNSKAPAKQTFEQISSSCNFATHNQRGVKRALRGFSGRPPSAAAYPKPSCYIGESNRDQNMKSLEPGIPKNPEIPKPTAKVLWKIDQIGSGGIPEGQLPGRSEGHAHGASLRFFRWAFRKECWAEDPQKSGSELL